MDVQQPDVTASSFFSLLSNRRGDGVMDCSAGHQEQK